MTFQSEIMLPVEVEILGAAVRVGGIDVTAGLSAAQLDALREEALEQLAP
jgi:hypothetical protein